MIKIPTFESFKKYERQAYAYIIIGVACFLFLALKANYEQQVKDCTQEKINLNNKIDTLYNKLIKLNENISVNHTRDSIH
jgi:hypothetical protein